MRTLLDRYFQVLSQAISYALSVDSFEIQTSSITGSDKPFPSNIPSISLFWRQVLALPKLHYLRVEQPVTEDKANFFGDEQGIRTFSDQPRA